MSSKRPSRIVNSLLDRYTNPPDATALRAEADRLRIGEIRLSSGSPSVIYLAEGEPSDRLATLEAFASVLFAVPVKVIALQSVPAWRRDGAWRASKPVATDGAKSP
jgi:hypothetical protein